jgi:large subunit ribosomal protein L29
VKPSELRVLTDEELTKKLTEVREELFNLRFQMSAAQLENPKRIRWVRREIARIETIRRERELKDVEAAG